MHQTYDLEIARALMAERRAQFRSAAHRSSGTRGRWRRRRRADGPT
jgi:hypothetical protein